MIDLYTWPTPNGHKMHIMLEELGLDYKVIPIDIGAGDQFDPEFLKISPNNKMPAMVDHDGPGGEPYAMCESGAMLMYLAEKTGRFMPQDMAGRYLVIQWLMFQMGGIGPMMGQANVFYRYFDENLPSVISRYQNESKRLFTVLEGQLRDREYLVDEFSIADIANWCWVRIYFWGGTNIDGLGNLNSWLQRLEARPACQRGIAVPKAIDFEQLEKDLEEDDSGIQALVTK